MPAILAEIAIPAAAGLIYAAIWYVTRELPRAARVLARVLPLVVLGPAVLYLSLEMSPHREEARRTAAARKEAADAPERPAPPQARPVPSPGPPAERQGPPAERHTEGPRATHVPDHEAAPGQPPGSHAATEESWDIVPVFFGTDRARSTGVDRVDYGPDRARRLELGRALVTVPRVHQVPYIERPFAIRIPYFRVAIYQQPEDPRQHFTIQEIRTLSAADFLLFARERIAGATAFKGQAVVFIHGYNTAFDHALYRTAQIAYDLKYDGGAFLYSWPSGGGIAAYGYDRESATQSEPYLRDFLSLVLNDTGANSVSVIAHSMGNLPLLNVLRDLGPALPPGVKLNQIILAAPDVDRDVFANLAAKIRQYGHGVTLYCSANDRAMSASRRIAGGVPRAGDVPPEGPIVISGIDTIDVTRTSTDLLALNHSTYAQKSALLNDIGLLLLTGERPPERRIPILEKVQAAAGAFWRYP